MLLGMRSAHLEHELDSISPDDDDRAIRARAMPLEGRPDQRVLLRAA